MIFFLVEERRKTDFEAPKFWKSQSGNWPNISQCIRPGRFPTDPFTILEPEDQKMGKF